jgi:hypothetical protein
VGTSRSQFRRHCGGFVLFWALPLIIADPLDKHIVGMQRIVKTAIVSPELDALLFGKGHIEIIICTLLEPLYNYKSAVHD